MQAVIVNGTVVVRDDRVLPVNRTVVASLSQGLGETVGWSVIVKNGVIYKTTPVLSRTNNWLCHPQSASNRGH